MLIVNKRPFATGMLMLAVFAVILWVIFSDVFPGPNGTKVNGIDFSDNLFNSLAKGSADYFGVVRANGRKFVGVPFTATIKPKDAKNAEKFAQIISQNVGAEAQTEIQLKAQVKDGKVVIQTSDLLSKGTPAAGATPPQIQAQVQPDGTIVIQGDNLTTAASQAPDQVKAQVKDGAVVIQGDDLFEFARRQIRDAEAMYRNDGKTVSATHDGMDPKFVMESWWEINSLVNKDLQKQRHFNQANFVNSINTRAIEPAFNFFGIQAKKVGDNVMLLTAALIFYVFYTVWYGFAIFELCAGFGLTHKKATQKHEV